MMKNTKDQKRCGKNASLIQYYWECKMVHPVWEMAWKIVIKLKLQLPYDAVNCILGHLSQRNETYVHTNTHTLMYIVGLSVIAKLRTLQVSLNRE